MIDIMKFIKEERMRQDISQSATAFAAMIDPATLYKWENYIHSPKFEEVVSILDFLGFEIVIRKKKKRREE